jgi:hypothetical protein
VPLTALLARPPLLGRALRRSSELLALEVECLDVPAAWILHGAGWPATVGEHGIALGPAPAEPRPPAEAGKSGPLAAVAEALRALPPSGRRLATLLALPSPEGLARAAGREGEPWSRATLQAFLRSVGELDVLVGVMFDGDDGAEALRGVLDHYQLAPVCIRQAGDARPVPPGAVVARAVGIEVAGGALVECASIVTSDGPVSPLVEPEILVKASRAMAERARAARASTQP